MRTLPGCRELRQRFLSPKKRNGGARVGRDLGYSLEAPDARRLADAFEREHSEIIDREAIVKPASRRLTDNDLVFVRGTLQARR